jgi:thiol-disulfide isomerase/thioredoxin
MRLNKLIRILLGIYLLSTVAVANDGFVFDFKTPEGKPFNLTIDAKGDWHFDGIKNKVVLLDFFGTWCPPCKAEIPHLNEIRKDLKQDFEIVGVDIGPRGGGETDIKELKQFIKKFDIKYPVVTGKRTRELFSGVANLNTSGSIPFMIAFGKNGKYLKHYIGRQVKSVLKDEMKYAINLNEG